MPENQEKKKPSIAKQILRYIGLGLLTLLLIAAVYFQAPWKVITLLSVMFLSCTVLPKPYRKWFWLSAGIVVIAVIVWVFLPDDNEGWQPYTFDNELRKLEAKYVIPDEENAATAYNQLFEALHTDENEPNFFYLSNPSSQTGPWLSKDHPEMTRWLQQHDKITTGLIQTSQLKNCRFAMDIEKARFGYTLSPLSDIRRATYWLVSSSNNDLAENRIGHAIEKSLTILRMSKHIYQRPTDIEMLIALAIEAKAYSQIRNIIILIKITEEQLKIVEESLSETKHSWCHDFPILLEYEKLPLKNTWGSFYQINSKGRIRRTRHPMLLSNSKYGGPMYYQVKLEVVLRWFFLPSNPQEIAEAIDKAYQKYYAMADPNFNWQKPIQESWPKVRCNYSFAVETKINMSEKRYHKTHDLYLRSIACQRGTRIIIALRRYKNKNGVWPKSLDDVKPLASAEIFIDPINNDSFVYKLTEDNFTLYSKGKNNIDENGKYESPEKGGPDDLLIWPSRSSKTKEENKDVK